MFNFGTSRTITISGPAIPRDSRGEPLLELRAFRGTETISELFEYEVDLVTPSVGVSDTDAANINLKKMIGKAVCITLQLEGNTTPVPCVGAGTREISGLVYEARFLRVEERRAFYRVIVRPWLALACGHTDNRVFQRKTVLEIIREVLSAYPFSFKFWEEEVYPTLDFQIQLGETDFDFVQRLMQEWGLFWFFEHEDGLHRMIITDHVSGLNPVKSKAYQTLSYYPPERRVDEREHVSVFDVTQTWQPGQWTTGDYDFKQPGAMSNQITQASLPQDTALNEIERYDWPGDYTDRDTGNFFANVRMQQLRSMGERSYGRGNLRDVECGTLFTLANHPQKEANQGYIVISATIDACEVGDVSGQASGEYRFETSFEVQPDSVVYRPARTIQRPPAGPQTAIVTSYGDREVWTDEYGRVKVRFYWDRLQPDDQTSSCWVRVSSAWAGQEMGEIAIPRVGEEVIVDFINGDPDRPLITGRVYNPQNMPPFELEDNHALTGYRSKEIHGVRANTMVLDDTKGKIQAQLNSDEGDSGLRLGWIARIAGNAGREEDRGRGFELATQLWGVVRAMRGLFMSTDPSSGRVKDVDAAMARLTQARAQHETLANTAQLNAAQDQGRDQSEVSAAIKAQNEAIKGGVASEDGNPFPEMTEPQLVLASHTGIETTAAQSTHVASGENIAMTAGAHLSLSVGARMLASVANGIKMFVERMGFLLVAAAGNIDMKALTNGIHMLAKLDITMEGNTIIINGKKSVEVRGGGSFTRWTDGQIYHGTLGSYEVHSASRLMTGPDNAPPPTLPKAVPGKDELHFALGALSNEVAHSYVEAPYELYKDGALIDKGVTDEYGRVVIKNHQPGTKSYMVKMYNDEEFNLNVKDALEAKNDHRANNGERLSDLGEN